MTETEQRIAIAEACGWDSWVIVKRGYYYGENAGGYTASINEAWKVPHAVAKKYEMYADRQDIDQCEKVLIERAPLPDYLHDLNAMHEAEKTLNREQKVRYRIFLSANSSGRTNSEFPTVESAMCHASAPQRAEAFLRANGKWKNTKCCATTEK